MSYSVKQVIEAGLRGYLEGCGGPHAGSRGEVDEHQAWSVQRTEDRALERCCGVDGFYDVIPLIMPWYRGEVYWEVGRQLCGEYVALLGQDLKREPFEPTTEEGGQDRVTNPFFIPATVAAAALRIELIALQRRKQRGKIEPEFMISKGQRLWIRSDYVYAEREKKSKIVAA
jgi:hypothetical protein